MRHLDLFSGIGGFALAADWVWGDVEHIFCDNEPFAQAVLAKHWPNAPIYGDIRTLTADAEARQQFELAMERKPKKKIGASFESDIDLLTGGFPCQPFSHAGRRRGTEDDRYLWPEMLRIIREFHPRWIIGENVGGLVTWNDGMVLEKVQSDLESEGYEVQTFVIPACAINAPHRRDRVWIVAHAQRFGRRKGSKLALEADPKKRGEGPIEFAGSDSDAPDADDERLEGRQRKEALGHSRQRNRSGGSQGAGWNENWTQVATRLCRVDDGISKRLDARGRIAKANRGSRLKALGNAIVPQVAAEIMRAIKAADAV
jgi:DNA (cytosine-5)-methyltransferase 1